MTVRKRNNNQAFPQAINNVSDKRTLWKCWSMPTFTSLKLVETFEKLKTQHDVFRNSLFELKLKGRFVMNRNTATQHWNKVLAQFKTKPSLKKRTFWKLVVLNSIMSHFPHLSALVNPLIKGLFSPCSLTSFQQTGDANEDIHQLRHCLDSAPNSRKWHLKKCMENNNENYYFEPGHRRW